MDKKTKANLIKFIKLNLQSFKTAPCENGKCYVSQFIDAGKLRDYIDSLEVK